MGGAGHSWSMALPAACIAAGMLFAGPPLQAATTEVRPGGDALAQAVAAAAPGDVLRLDPGVHSGPIFIDRPLSLLGEPGAVIDGRRLGRTLDVRSPGVVIRHLALTGSGLSLEKMDAAIFLEQTATGAVVEDNEIKDNLVGVYIHGARGAMVRETRANAFIDAGTRWGQRRECSWAAWCWCTGHGGRRLEFLVSGGWRG